MFDGTGSAHPAVTLDASNTVAGLKFDTTATSYTITGVNTLTLGGVLPYVQQKSANAQSLGFSTLNLAANAVFDVTGAGNLSVSAAITGASNLIKDGTGAGKLILSGSNTGYSGNIFVNNGVLQVANSNALGATSGATTVSDGAALEINGGTILLAENVTLRGTGVAGDGAIRSIAGTNTLSGALSLAGDSRINSDSGTLTLSGGITSASNAGLSLGGAGNIAGDGKDQHRRGRGRQGWRRHAHLVRGEQLLGRDEHQCRHPGGGRGQRALEQHGGHHRFRRDPESQQSFRHRRFHRRRQAPSRSAAVL